MSRFAKLTKAQIRERLEIERKNLKAYQNRLNQLAPNAWVHEYIMTSRKEADAQAEILHLESMLNDPMRGD
jgi:hypothetical protein